MAKENSQKLSNGFALDFEAQLWAAEQAVPAPHLKMTNAAGKQRQLRLDSTFHPSPLARRRGGIRHD
jgi:hypothetical protein